MSSALKLCFLFFFVFKQFLFGVYFNFNEGTEIFLLLRLLFLINFILGSLELLSIIIAPASWGAVFYLDIPS